MLLCSSGQTAGGIYVSIRLYCTFRPDNITVTVVTFPIVRYPWDRTPICFIG